jgi:hypothetical protein
MQEVAETTSLKWAYKHAYSYMRGDDANLAFFYDQGYNLVFYMAKNDFGGICIVTLAGRKPIFTFIKKEQMK